MKGGAEVAGLEEHDVVDGAEDGHLEPHRDVEVGGEEGVAAVDLLGWEAQQLLRREAGVGAVGDAAILTPGIVGEPGAVAHEHEVHIGRLHHVAHHVPDKRPDAALAYQPAVDGYPHTHVCSVLGF